MHFDVVVVGAGLSGIGAARRIKRMFPNKTFAILEAKDRVGGTWDLFRYPGIRSDSDMYTMGYDFKPWRDAKAIADGESILAYIEETADEEGLTQHIRFNNRVVEASWSSADSRWTLVIEHRGSESRSVITCGFLLSCAGYYSHDKAHLPQWPGYDAFEGAKVHPQFWPSDLDYAGKRVVVIGSGATAVTLSPVLAQSASHVVQLQRSPTYVVSRPARDSLALLLRRLLPERIAYNLVRWRNIVLGRFFNKQILRNREGAKRLLISRVAKALPGFDVATHFTPRYLPWEQRLCLIPDGDLFAAIRNQKLSIVTDEIERFDATGIVLQSGARIDADIVVAATGLELQFFGGATMIVDGQRIDPGKLLIYKGFMCSNVPNLIFTIGYTNASWTLKADLVAKFACRLLAYMDNKGAVQATPVAAAEEWASLRGWSDFNSGYITRAQSRMPKLGGRFPWFNEQDYLWDRKVLGKGKIEDGVLVVNGKRPIELPEPQRAPEIVSESVAAQ